MTVVLMMLAGGAGAVTRYSADAAIQRRGDGRYPWGTFAVNVAGCLLLGLVWGWVDQHSSDKAFRTVAGTGFCGGLTTFSTFTVESVRLIEARRYAAAAGYLVTSLLAGAAAVVLGLAVTG